MEKCVICNQTKPGKVEFNELYICDECKTKAVKEMLQKTFSESIRKYEGVIQRCQNKITELTEMQKKLEQKTDVETATIPEKPACQLRVKKGRGCYTRPANPITGVTGVTYHNKRKLYLVSFNCRNSIITGGPIKFRKFVSDLRRATIMRVNQEIEHLGRENAPQLHLLAQYGF